MDDNRVIAFFHKSDVAATYTIRRPAKVFQETADIIEISLWRPGANAFDELLAFAHRYTPMVLPLAPRVNRFTCGIMVVTSMSCSRGNGS